MLTCESCNQEHRPSERGLSVDECALLQHVMLWGSHGYPIHRLTRGGGRISQGRGHTMGWTWDYRTIKGPPTVFKTKRAAVESVERFLDILRDAKAGRI